MGRVTILLIVKMKIMKYTFLITIIVLIVFGSSSCVHTKPMTKTIHRNASIVGKVENFQYYVSRNIVLTKSENPDIIGKVAVKGSIKATYHKDVIQITSSTEGALLKWEKDADGNIIYYVAFEPDNDNCLRFKQKTQGSEERIYLLYDDNETHAVNYGDEVYVVEWKGAEGLKASRGKAQRDDKMGKFKGKFKGVVANETDDPHLLVKMNIKIKEKENYRKAAGRKVQVK